MSWTRRLVASSARASSSSRPPSAAATIAHVLVLIAFQDSPECMALASRKRGRPPAGSISPVSRGRLPPLPDTLRRRDGAPWTLRRRRGPLSSLLLGLRRRAFLCGGG